MHRAVVSDFLGEHVPALSLKTKMTVAVSLLIAVLLCILSFWSRIYFVDQIRSLVSSQQFSMVSAIAEQVDDRLLSNQTELVTTAGTLNASTINDRARLESFFGRRPDTLAMFDNGLFLFSPQGNLLYENPGEPDMLVKNYAHRDYLKKTLATHAPQISEPFISGQTHRHPVIMFTAPVFGAKGEIIAILGGSLDLTQNNFLGKLATIKQGEHGYLYLYNNSRVLIVHPDRDRIMKQDVPPGANVLFDRAIAGFEGTGETTNSRNIAVICSFKRLKSTGWILASN